MFHEVYAAILEGKQPNDPSFPSFKDGLRELMLCEAILKSHKDESWVGV
jgi:predicted dehydrogenase